MGRQVDHTLYMPVSALDLPYGPFGGPVSDVCEVCSDLLVHGGEALAVLSAEAGLLLLVDDLVESLVQEDGEPLPLIIRRGYIAWMVFGDLGDVIRDVSHTWMIGRIGLIMQKRLATRPEDYKLHCAHTVLYL